MIAASIVNPQFSYNLVKWGLIEMQTIADQQRHPLKPRTNFVMINQKLTTGNSDNAENIFIAKI